MKKIGVILIVVGIAITIFSGIAFKTEEKVLEVGDIEITREDEKELTWPRWAGVAVFAGGVVVLVLGAVKRR